LFKGILPHDVSFFDYFEQHIALTIEGCKEFLALTSNDADIPARVSRIRDIEHETDEITHRCIESLHKTFITPFDRSDIHNLIKRLDDIMDTVDAAASRITLYEVKEIRPEAKALAEVLVRATGEIEQALKNLRNLKHAQAIKDRCIAIHNLENQADDISRAALGRLFKEENQPLLIIKWKEIFQRLERATDRCEDVANIIEGVLLEAT
jgi:predicted phosphate transport protein (TIGR00153 family)